MNLRTNLIVVGSLLVGLAALLLGVQIFESNRAFNGSLIEPSPPAVDFTLSNSDGSDYHLANRKGQIVLIFFGYANCPDVCPTTLAEFRNMHAELGEDADLVDFVFITIDPERDASTDIERYVKSFNENFIGLSGQPEELRSVWDGYWVFREKQESDSEAGYLMAHTSRVYLVDKAGNLRLTFPFGVTASAMLDDVERLLKE
jgi:protein SCO1/2